MDLEIRHLQLVAAVADLGSLTKAGQRIHLTQSALSHQLRDIESRLGAALFLRIGKRLVLTPAGERLLAVAQEVLGRLQHTEDEIRRLGRGRASLLRLTTECYTCYHWLAPLLLEYRRRFPRVEVRIDIDGTGEPMPRLLAGKLDLAIVTSPVRDRRLVERRVFDDEMVVIVAPTHPLAQRPHVRPADFQDQALLVYPPKADSILLSEILLPAGVTPARVEEVPLTEAITEMVRAGLGLALLPRWAVQPLADRGLIAARPLTAKGLQRRWNAVTPKTLAGADYVRGFIDLLIELAPTAKRGQSPQKRKRRVPRQS
jgi:LysR family transcriptional regulator for metE and metH